MATIDIDGVSTHYDEEGEGDPLVLLHGGLSDSSAWGMQTPAFTASYRVFAPDRRGHGRTHDTDAAYTYEAMAAETITFLEQVVGGSAHLVGWSDGGDVALLVAAARPDLVRRMVVIGANFHHDGLMHSAGLGEDPDSSDLDLFRSMHDALTPGGPEHWPVFFRRTAQLWREGPTMTVEDLAAIDVPTLVLAGDDDAIRFDHTCSLYEALPASQLAIVPGASHFVLMEKPELANRLVLDFLAETEPPATLFPLRRA
jgi:pimeloyl-ACP methyl ester carboxylesterase